ncbi:CD3324 family protein [Treponema brennaborense]|uniref:Mor transcription activator domain-containing protein n=1 Tax=Treponema brennaborense (strain DSM 12168 / CIP 105900 / DD5/3) TaxID=906968 RepID=F4LLC9_TREBD|nr:CD3324 family protein [Treponema brennaborense]AEE15607.1 hypothetical protein Trebr_0155 [Treponema brennaborense DSM 12168]
MGYVKAGDVLPAELLDAVQRYADGVYLYIPRRGDSRKKWGEANCSREQLARRNREICDKYADGVPVSVLAETYFLSGKRIYKIIADRLKTERV